jgi:hypothetical protein
VKLCSIVFGVIGSLWFGSGAAFSDTVHHWTQLGAGSEMIVRAIVRVPECPVLRVDGQAVPMEQRAAPTARYLGRVCERRLSRSAAKVVLDDRRLPTVKPEVRRIAVIGDTGCRIKGSRAQACNDPQAWPLEAIMAELVEQQPDLVVHVGDYVYREGPCPPSTRCLGSPYGDDGPTWAADWFDPAQQLLSRAPFVFLRGNHETCGRAAKGWFRYLAPGPIPAECPAVSEPWRADVAGVVLIVFDSSDGPDARSSRHQLRVYRQMADAMFATVDREAWFLTHRPLWAFMRAFGEIITGDDTQRDAFGATIPQAVGLILSGHLHAFQALDLATGPAQLISGNGGTQLDPMPNESGRNVEVAGSLARQITSDAGFGFLMLHRTGEAGWRVDVMDARGMRRHRCQLSGRDLACGVRPQ